MDYFRFKSQHKLVGFALGFADSADEIGLCPGFAQGAGESFVDLGFRGTEPFAVHTWHQYFLGAFGF